MKYQIKGEPLPVVICTLDAGEQMVTERGSMAWMSANMSMETSGGGGIGKALGRMFAGEAVFQNIYTPKGGPGMIAFASSFAGTIKAFEISPGNEMLCQKGVFLAGEQGVSVDVQVNKRAGAGFFGGEGFIMQKVSGNGTFFAEMDGHVVEYELKPGQEIIVSSGHLAAMTASCNMDVRTVAGTKNKLLGGEGFFHTVVTGPGRVWLQTMPIGNVASALQPFLTTGSSGGGGGNALNSLFGND